jgi:hypothetical protein
VKGAIGADAVEAAVQEMLGTPDRKHLKPNNPSGSQTTLPLVTRMLNSSQSPTVNVVVETDAEIGAAVVQTEHLKGAQKLHRSLHPRKRTQIASRRKKRLQRSHNSVRNKINSQLGGSRSSQRKNVSPVALCSIADLLEATMTMLQRPKKTHQRTFPSLQPL